MAYTLLEIQAVLANLKATYLSLTLQSAQQLTQAGRSITLVAMDKVMEQIKEWEEREQAATDVDNLQQGGVAYARFDLPR